MVPDVPALWERYTRARGRVHLTGLQALVRLPLDQVRRDRAAGRRVAALVSGYPGSPLAGFDLALRGVEPLLAEHDVRLVPALNEELAAAAIGGTQMLDLFPHGDLDGVFGLWFGKAPGLDRALDAIRHANFVGISRWGGALALVGDDPFCKSSSLPSHSEYACAHAMMPLLAPGDAGEALELGLLGIALSRYAGLWVGLKVVADVADGGAIVELPTREPSIELPKFEVRGHPFAKRLDPRLLPPHVNAIEEEIFYERLEAARRFAWSNRLDRIEVHHPGDRLGLVASGRLYRELVTALERLGLDDRRLETLGVRVLRLGMLWPLEPRRLAEFADGLDEIIVVDERRGFIEDQVRSALFNALDRPQVLGQRDQGGDPWLARHAEISSETLAIDLAGHLSRRLDAPELAKGGALLHALAERRPHAIELRRAPQFCSGCPHSTSTRLPEGSIAGGGIGCHTMALLMDRGVRYIGSMGSEGAHWMGLAPYVETEHLFQNLGDGTYFHSGRLAVRAAVEAGENITYKLLYNGTIAMTGGQPAVGQKPLVELVADLLSDGVRVVVAVSDDPELRRMAEPRVECIGRDAYDAAMRRLRTEPGVTALVYDQLCAKEKQRLERRGILARPGERIAIHADVCEGCGDCQVKSTCASLRPVETPLGRKTRVHESSCSDDRTCLEGDCPSFLSVAGERVLPDPERWLPDALPDPSPAAWREERYEVFLVGIGSTGVVTVDAILVRAAELDGLYALHLDQTGLAQRGGKVVSHCVFGRRRLEGSPRVGWGRADTALAFDPLGASDEQGLRVLDPERTRVVIQPEFAPTGEMVAHPEMPLPDAGAMVERVRGLALETRELPAEELAEAAFGEPLHANVILLGFALQQGLVPLSPASVEQAIRDRRVAVERNLLALRLGRALAADPGLATRILEDARPPSAGEESTPAEASLLLGVAWERFDEALTRFPPSTDLMGLRRRAAGLAVDLVDYQNRAYATRYLRALTVVARRESATTPASCALSTCAARELYRLMAYKDEYEVGRLLLRGPYRRWLERHYRPLRLRYHLHPPLLRALGLRRKLRFGPSLEPLLRILLRMRRLRGSALDPFGHTRVRRVQRQLVLWYEALLEELVDRLTPSNADSAVAIAAAAGCIRGYEEIALGRADEVQRDVAEKLAALPE